MSDRWPNLFIVGAGKAGTTSLHRYLGEHPEIFMCPEKEAQFFSKRWDGADDADDLAAAKASFLELFADAGDAPIRGTTSPDYIWRPEVPQRIAQVVPDARILASLRDPIERAWSGYLMRVRRGAPREGFLEEVRADLSGDDDQPQLVRRGFYAQHLERYLDRFGRDRVKVVLFEDLKSDTLGLLQEIAGFLDVDPEAMERVDHETVHNPYGVPRNAVARWLLQDESIKAVARRLLPEDLRIALGEHVLLEKPDKPTMDPKAREILVEAYEPEIERLEAMLGRDLPELRVSWDDGDV